MYSDPEAREPATITIRTLSENNLFQATKMMQNNEKLHSHL